MTCDNICRQQKDEVSCGLHHGTAMGICPFLRVLLKAFDDTQRQVQDKTWRDRLSSDGIKESLRLPNLSELDKRPERLAWLLEFTYNFQPSSRVYTTTLILLSLQGVGWDSICRFESCDREIQGSTEPWAWCATYEFAWCNLKPGWRIVYQKPNPPALGVCYRLLVSGIFLRSYAKRVNHLRLAVWNDSPRPSTNMTEISVNPTLASLLSTSSTLFSMCNVAEWEYHPFLFRRFPSRQLVR